MIFQENIGICLRSLGTPKVELLIYYSQMGQRSTAGGTNINVYTDYIVYPNREIMLPGDAEICLIPQP